MAGKFKTNQMKTAREGPFFLEIEGIDWFSRG